MGLARAWFGRGRWSLGLGALGTAYLVAGGLLPLGNWLIYPLEQRFPARHISTGAAVRGIIILGGGEDGRISTSRGTLALTEAGERVTEGARLAHALPEAQVVFSGGGAELWPGGHDGTEAVAAFLADMGIARERILLESRSRNTFENALYTRDLVHPQAGETWLLVTSAYHIPRAVGAFRQAGFDVLAFPVDYRTSGPGDIGRPFASIPDGLKRADEAVKEWIGLAAYRIMGRSAALFPAP